MRPSGQAGASPAELAPRKPFSSARRVDRAALAPHRAPGAQAVRVICFSCGRTRPATICQAPGLRSRRKASRDKPWPGTSSSSSSWIRRASHAARAATAQPAHPDRARVAHATHICCVQVLLARTHQCEHARRRAAGHVRRVGEAPQSFVCVSRKRCAPCLLHIAVFDEHHGSTHFRSGSATPWDVQDDSWLFEYVLAESVSTVPASSCTPVVLASGFRVARSDPCAPAPAHHHPLP